VISYGSIVQGYEMLSGVEAIQRAVAGASDMAEFGAYGDGPAHPGF
jgi:hypothetical protein